MKHILIAEDEPKLRFSLSCILKGRGYKVSLADNGNQALEIIKESHNKQIDLILLDIQMPHLNGLQFLDELEKLDCPSPPTLVMTGFGSREILLEIIHRGCIEYIDKPFTPEELFVAIDNSVKKVESIERKRNKESANSQAKLKGIENEK